MLFVCCPLTERTTNEHQTDNKRTTDIVILELMYSQSSGKVYFFITFVCIKLNHEICYGKETLLR